MASHTFLLALLIVAVAEASLVSAADAEAAMSPHGAVAERRRLSCSGTDNYGFGCATDIWGDPTTQADCIDGCTWGSGTSTSGTSATTGTCGSGFVCPGSGNAANTVAKDASTVTADTPGTAAECCEDPNAGQRRPEIPNDFHASGSTTMTVAGMDITAPTEIWFDYAGQRQRIDTGDSPNVEKVLELYNENTKYEIASDGTCERKELNGELYSYSLPPWAAYVKTESVNGQYTEHWDVDFFGFMTINTWVEMSADAKSDVLRKYNMNDGDDGMIDVTTVFSSFAAGFDESAFTVPDNCPDACTDVNCNNGDCIVSVTDFAYRCECTGSYSGVHCDQANVDCAGSWGDCTSSCTRVWTETTAKQGGGQACPAQGPACAQGEDLCPQVVPCRGAFVPATCAADCAARTYEITQAAENGGTECTHVHGHKSACAIGDGDCDGIHAKVSGYIIDAVTGAAISGVTVTSDGTHEEKTTDSYGKYTFDVFMVVGEDQGICFTATKAGYITGHITLAAGNSGIAVMAGSAADFFLSPELPVGTDFRVVLSWAAQPSDLDSHLIFSNACEVYYGAKSCSSGGASATLDRDSTSGYGPETVTVNNIASAAGDLQHFIHVYNNAPFQNNAVAKLYGTCGLMSELKVQTSGSGRYWATWDLHRDGTFTVVDSVTSQAPTANGSGSSGGSSGCISSSSCNAPPPAPTPPAPTPPAPTPPGPTPPGPTPPGPTPPGPTPPGPTPPGPTPPGPTPPTPTPSDVGVDEETLKAAATWTGTVAAHLTAVAVVFTAAALQDAQ